MDLFMLKVIWVKAQSSLFIFQNDFLSTADLLYEKKADLKLIRFVILPFRSEDGSWTRDLRVMNPAL